MPRATILLGLALVAVLGASGASLAVVPPAHAAPGAEKPVLVSADELQYDQDLGLTIAKGHVELDETDQILLADMVTYNQRTDTVTASGHVSLLQPTGDILFGNYVELHNDMRDGFIQDIRMLLSDQSRLAGNTGRRVNGTRTEIRRGVYSPCALCSNDPTRPPVWQIKAEEVVDDKQLKLIEYHDAVMEIDGVPVFYTPYMSNPEPSVKRASGFLVPNVGYSNTLGFHTAIPYYWVIAPDKDATFRPIITTGAGVVFGGEYRQRFGDGYTTNDGSIEVGGGRQTASTANVGPPTGPVRGHLFGTGEWDLSNDWRLGYLVQRASDQTYMLRYGFTTPSNYLTTHFFAENFGPDSYANISAYDFQSLNPLIGDSVESAVLPIASYDWHGTPDRWGGTASLSGNALNLIRRTGPEERRLSTSAGWELPFNGAFGDRFTFVTSVRTDGYDSDHVALTPNFTSLTSSVGTTVELPSNVGTSSEWAGRVFPSAMLKWRYPWVRTASDGSALIEPIAAVIANPNGENPARIPNVDSQGFEFDELSLFVPNRLPGYDRVDSGQRVDYGVHGDLQTRGWGNWDMLVGQSYRFEQSSVFALGSGLEDRVSDIVGRAAVVTGSYVDLLYRFRLNKSDLAMRRQEVQVSAGPKSLRASVSFISIAATQGSSAIIGSPVGSGVPAGNQVGAAINAELTRTWSIALNDTRSFGSGGATIGAGAALTYRDDCFAVVGSISQSGIRVGDVRPGVSVLLTLVFKNLGEVSEKVFSASGS